MDMAIVTGGSKGLGYEISKLFAEQGMEVIGLSRSMNEKVQNLITNSEGCYTHCAIDLAKAEEIEPLLIRLCRKVVARAPQKLYVINNAGTVKPIERLGYLDNRLIEQAVHLNLLAPILINNTLFKALKNETIELIIVNVTSGAAERPIHGWNVYSTTKAAITMHTKVAGLEQEHANSAHKIVAFSPGIMDTEMQGTIRGSDQAAFKDIDQFVRFKSQGALRNPREVAEALMHLLLTEPLKNGKVYDVNELT
ncbi:SDR family NAD(P)-dependent oxidoreductase [Sporolactobacillus kofuensis]|uniref:SDR family NAD(P)-dependent oxidoreductase n=1 Tax=Sporolactobacillus kofuensis TaxID=269672 RepID=A0ABW1WD75_9BACL|nr:SDR family NAD(P)-dependent oxidoreductase [Sporolactobacillus kofuensis]MCO7175736.1 SDR family NAD(P)-dependent oxidoreductase [Sporolactobacillus kofuensis]